MMRLLCLLAFLFPSITAQAVTHIVIKATDIAHPQGQEKDFSLELNLQEASPALHLNTLIKQTSVKNNASESTDKDWAQLNLSCQLPMSITTGRWDCAQGLLKTARINMPFSIEVQHLFVNKALDVNAVLQLNNASFSDEAGLHAAEKFTGKMTFAFKPIGQAWVWQTMLDWQTGEVFWQPFYMANGGHQFSANGVFENDILKIDRANIQIKEVGAVNFNADLRLTDFKLLNLNGNLPDLNLTTAYPLLFKPFLEKTAFSHTDIAGKAALDVTIKDTQLMAFNMRLSGVDIADQNQKFAFYKINADIPWRYDEAKIVKFSYESGELLKMPLGNTNITAEVNRYALTAPNIRLPILDGALNLSDISAARLGENWYWHLRAKLESISMTDFTASLKLPRMAGQASAEIPLVTYSDGVLTTDGSLILKVFNGTATVTALKLEKPLGNTPKLNANIALRNLDLGDLTRTFSFGAIEGKLDGDIKQLEMQNWKPVKFDAMVQSSAGKYPKKISQRAVENISALGGAGAAAAVQRSVLRFFEQFNYEKLGLSCQLRNDICKMSGVESTPQGYIIVKGSGIPAITVMGYNQSVGWADLLGRIKRVTDGNSKAVIK